MLNVEIAVVGTGPNGLAAAAAMARSGRDVALIGPAAGRSTQADTRTAALFTGSVALLRNLGALDDLASAIAPLRGIRIVDDGDHLLRAPEILFDAQELGLSDFGANVPQMPLVDALWAAVGREPSITAIDDTFVRLEPSTEGTAIHLQSGRLIGAKLVVAADGRASSCRKAAGIETKSWSYPQTAVAAQFSHTRPHRDISTEFHRPAGPCTVVPMPGNRSSLVWVEAPTVAENLVRCDEAAFLAALEPRLHGLLGRLSDVGPRRLFPLTCLKAVTLGADRVALVGDAGHTMPPIGAQGLNLGFRDVAVLADLVSRARATGADIGAPDLLAHYSRARTADISARTAAVDLLNRSLLLDLLPIDLVRGAGLHAIAAFSGLKRQVMRAGFEPVGGLPSLMLA